MLGAIIEHVRETSIGEEHLGVGGSNLRDEVEHDVALGGAKPREVHAGESPQVLPSDGPGPQSLDAVQSLHSVHEESAPKPARGIQTRRNGRPADEEAAQQRGHDDGDPAGDKRVKGQVPDDLEQRRHPEIFVGKFSFSGGY